MSTETRTQVEGIEWTAHVEPRSQGGETYVRCTGCGIEVLAGREEHAEHRTGCEVDR